MKQGGPQRGQNAENHRNGNRSQVDEQDAGGVDESRNAVKVINVPRKYVLAREPAQELFDFIDVSGHPKAQPGSQNGSNDSEQESIAEKDLHHSSVGSTQGLEDADIARLLHDDHREDGQDAEAGHADDQEQKNVQN